jgi:hypothetical protein
MADTTVAALSIKVSATTAQFKSAMRGLKPVVRKASKDISRMGKVTKIMAQAAIRPVKMLRRQIGAIGTAARGVLRIMGGPLGRLGWFGGLGVLGLPALGAGFALKIAAEYEQAALAFDVMIGNAKLAKQVLEEMVLFAARTPFQFPDLQVAGKQLLAFGISAKDIIPTLSMLGDISAGLSVPIKELAWLYGQTKVEQRLYARDLRQFTTRGIPLITELAKQFRVAESAVRDLVAEGKVGFGHVQRALLALTSAGGRFFQLTQRSSRTLMGLWTTLKDSVWLTLKDVGEMLVKEFDLKRRVADWIARINMMKDEFVAVIKTIIRAIRHGVAAAWGLVKWGVNAIWEKIKWLWEGIGKILGAIAELPIWGRLGEQLQGLWAGLQLSMPQELRDQLEAFGKAWGALTEALREFATEWKKPLPEKRLPEMKVEKMTMAKIRAREREAAMSARAIAAGPAMERGSAAAWRTAFRGGLQTEGIEQTLKFLLEAAREHLRFVKARGRPQVIPVRTIP